MIAFVSLRVHVLVSPFKTQARLEAEIVFLRHQLDVLRRRAPAKPRLTIADRMILVWFYRLFPSVLSAITIIQPDTIIRGRPKVPMEIRRQIRDMSLANRLWGAPRIHGEPQRFATWSSMPGKQAQTWRSAILSSACATSCRAITSCAATTCGTTERPRCRLGGNTEKQ
jgi:hypothetical protein